MLSKINAGEDKMTSLEKKGYGLWKKISVLSRLDRINCNTGVTKA